VLAGDLDAFVEALNAAERAEQLAGEDEDGSDEER
jgi:hypothetical protein